MTTLVAATVLEVSVPTTATCEPTVTSANVGAVTPRSRYVVVPVTSTVTTVPCRVAIVKVSAPTDFTVPTAAGVVPEPFPNRWPPKLPMTTLVAATVLEVSVPTTATCEPTVTSANVGAVTPRSRYVVVPVTSTVTTVPCRVAIVKVSAPTDFTVPTAAGVVPEPFPNRWPPKLPMTTLVAATVLEVSVPTTATCEPTVTSANVGAVTPRSRYVVVPVTSTVTTVPCRVVIVKVSAPTDFTVPTAAGVAPPNGGACLGVSFPGVLSAPLVVAAPAIPPDANARPRATAETPAIRAAVDFAFVPPPRLSDIPRSCECLSKSVSTLLLGRWGGCCRLPPFTSDLRAS